MKRLLVPLIIFFQLLSAYDVRFEGVDDPEALTLMREVSQLVQLKETPPDTTFGLKRRAEEDRALFVDALHSLAYYNARIDITINHDVVDVAVDLGPKYLFEAYTIVPAPGSTSDFPYDEISGESLGITIGSPALPEKILKSEEELLHLLAGKGYPFGKIVKREVIADQETKTITVYLFIDPGPSCLYGKTTITGASRTSSRYFTKRIRWQEGGRYSPEEVEATRNELERSGIFSSVLIAPAAPDENGRVPMAITVVEAKQRTIGFGVSYTTQLGGGVAAEWENRNFRGLGERLSLNFNIWQRFKEGNLAYTIPQFCSRHQDLVWLFDVEEDITKGYTARAASLSSTIIRRIDRHSQLSYGTMLKVLKDSHSDNDRDFTLFKTPIEYRWSNADSILDPTLGISADLRMSPSVQIFDPRFYYQTNTFTLSSYCPVTTKTTLAAKAVIGSIFGSPQIVIPPSERFYAGTDSLLRGYQYKTVSPLDAENDPIGGRSMMIYSFELRHRFNENWGGVLFYETGNVYSQVYPPFGKKMLNSIGVGGRYHTPVGPLRADVAFPLNPRPGIDNSFQFYISIGQSF